MESELDRTVRQVTGPELHATCVSVMGMGVLLLGPSGSGKSDLALRLIDQAGGADVLVADDRVLVELCNGRLTGRAPQALRGRLEVRGLGVVAVPYQDQAEIELAVSLKEEAGDRIPDFDRQVFDVCGSKVPCLILNAFEASAPAKVRAMVRAMTEGAFANHVPTNADR